ncbi:hypothetical protein QP426_04465 [Pauljensenia sp. UMB1235]|uniref:hypothetical protein n=1 Tax=unclassified Pauljensenia TaxID=2908895 RepID=UPI00254CA327|nr:MULTISPECIES: hypothetical protein [unclassified Pauljensenia]MDK6400420.1 hypothetical protein [Pauljensenia sp. UMB9872]MDK7172921.1 hypothetical protein [Pauljensenia sp. UMB1235]
MTDQQPSPEEAEKQEGSPAEEQFIEANAEETEGAPADTDSTEPVAQENAPEEEATELLPTKETTELPVGDSTVGAVEETTVLPTKETAETTELASEPAPEVIDVEAQVVEDSTPTQPTWEQNPWASPAGEQPATASQGAYTAPQFDQQNPYGQPGVQPEQPYGQYNGGQYGANGFAQAPYGMTFQMTPLAQELKSNSNIVLILGILGLVLIGLFGSIPAWLWGNSILRQAQENGVSADIVSNAKVGRILGIVGVALWGVATAFVVLMIPLIMLTTVLLAA